MEWDPKAIWVFGWRIVALVAAFLAGLGTGYVDW